MKARKAVNKFGKLLIGQKIRTFPMGTWPGGLAKIKSIYPDGEDYKDTVLEIRGLEKQNKMNIGVFWDEEIEIV